MAAQINKHIVINRIRTIASNNKKNKNKKNTTLIRNASIELIDMKTYGKLHASYLSLLFEPSWTNSLIIFTKLKQQTAVSHD